MVNYRIEEDGKYHLDIDDSGRFGLPFANYKTMRKAVKSKHKLRKVAYKEQWGVASNYRGWYIVEIYSGRTKFIGHLRARRTNYLNNAIREAVRRNRKHGIKGYVHIPAELSEDRNLRKAQLARYAIDALGIPLFMRE